MSDQGNQQLPSNDLIVQHGTPTAPLDQDVVSGQNQAQSGSVNDGIQFNNSWTFDHDFAGVRYDHDSADPRHESHDQTFWENSDWNLQGFPSVPGCAVNNYIDSGHENPCMQNILHILNHHQTHENTSKVWIKLDSSSYKGVEYDDAKKCHTARKRVLDSDEGEPLGFISWDQWIEEQLEPANKLYLKYNESLLRMQHFSTLMKRVNKDRARREQKEKKRKTKLRVEKAQLTKDKNEDKKQRMVAKHLELLDDAIKITETHINDYSRNHTLSS